MSSHLKSSAAIAAIDSALNTPIKPFSITVPNATRTFGIGKTRIYEHIKSGRVRVSKDGHRTLLIYEDLERLIADGISATAAEPEHLKKSQKRKKRGSAGDGAASTDSAD
jgi:hypothetical protein